MLDLASADSRFCALLSVFREQLEVRDVVSQDMNRLVIDLNILEPLKVREKGAPIYFAAGSVDQVETKPVTNLTMSPVLAVSNGMKTQLLLQLDDFFNI